MAESEQENEQIQNNFKNVLKQMLTKTIKKTSIIILIVIIVLLFTAGSYFVIMDLFSDKVSEFMSNNKIKYSTEDNSVVIEDEEIKLLEEVLADIGMSKEELKLTTEDLKKIYLAEVLPLEICRVKPENQEEGKYYGKIYIKKVGQTTEDSVFLEYKPLSEFEQLNSTDILNYFSIDEEKICVANVITKTDSSGNVIEEKIDIQKLAYKEKVLKYMMPVEFLLDLCAITQNPGFVLALADKAINETEIVITVFPESEETQTISTERYQIETQTSTEEYTYNGSGALIDYNETEPETTIGEEQQEPQTTEITKTINSSLKITYVNSWFSNQVYTYNQVEKVNDPQTFEELLEDTEWAYARKLEEETTNSDNSVTKTYTKQGTKRINRKQISTINVTTTTYEQGVEKQETDKIEELLEIFKTKYKLPESIKEEAAIGKIVDGSEILFHMLANSERTQTAEYVLKYILYVYTGNSYGITNFDLSMFKPSEFYSIVGSLYGNTVEEKVWFALLNAGCSKESAAGVLGNLWAESGFRTNNLENSFEYQLGYTDETYTEAVNSGAYTLEQFISDHTNENCGAGYGLAQWTYCTRKEGLYNYAKNKGASIDDVDMQIEYLLGELNLSNNASGFATYVLYSRKGFEVGDWKDATTPEDAAEAFCWIFENPAGSYDTARSSKAREYYEKYKSLDDGGNFVGGSNADSIIGTFTSTVTGRTFTIFNQMKIVTDRQWNDRCNRAAQISVCSGYYSGNTLELINEVESIAPRDTTLYTKCGLSYQNMNSGIDSTHTFDKNVIRGQIINGGYVVLYVRGSEVGDNGISKYGRDWASAMHWVAILGYRNNGTVEEIFVSDSGHGNTGWVPLDEFDTITASVVFVNEK